MHSALRISAAALAASLVAIAAPRLGLAQIPPLVRGERERIDPSIILTTLHGFALFEREASKICLSSTAKESIRALAADLMQHSQIIDGALEALAVKGIGASRSAELDSSHERRIEQLRALDTPHLDARYLQAMRGGYEQLLQDLRSYQINGPDGAVKDLVNQIMVRAQMNLDKILRTQTGF